MHIIHVIGLKYLFLVQYRARYTINHDSSTHTSCSIYSSMTFVQTIHIKICIIYIFLRIVNTFTTYIYYMCIRYSYDCKIFHCINNCLFYIHNSNISSYNINIITTTYHDSTIHTPGPQDKNRKIECRTSYIHCRS